MTMTSKLNNNILLKTYRYDFSEEIEYKLREFASIHQYDERKQIKESWKKWINEEPKKTEIENETKRLNQLGYTGDVLTKMYTSIRYYYMKKKPTKDQKEDNDDNDDDDDESKEKKPRKRYINVSPIILELIDNHILSEIKKCSKNNISSYVPSNAYLDFCKEHQTNIMDEIILLKDVLNEDEIIIKFKKTYKNRYQNIKNKSIITYH